MKPVSLKLRLALLVALLGLLQAAAVLAFAHFALDEQLDVQSRHMLRDKAQQARLLIDEMQNAVAVKDNAFKLAELLIGHPDLHLAVASSRSGSTYVAFSSEAAESLARLNSDSWAVDGFLVWQRRSGNSMLSLASSSATRDGQAYAMVLTVDRARDQKLLRGQLLTAVTAVPFALALVFLAAMAAVAVGLRPLAHLKQAVGGVSAKALAGRIDTRTMPTELAGLAQAFNEMLDRLDEGVTRLSQFSGDLAHEMRTPLATLLGRTQVALSQPRGAEQLVDVLEANVEELQRLARLVSDMLFLAQADHAQSAVELELVELAHEASQIAEFLEPVAQQREIAIAVQGQATVQADKGLVRRAITNLLTNAVRHCTPGTKVVVSVTAQGDGARLDVVNHGSPIAPQHLARLFDRFYRIDHARARDAGGTGLGLAIVRAILALHGGTARAESTAAGEIRFSLVFPGR